jgi:hypothetical protein
VVSKALSGEGLSVVSAEPEEDRCGPEGRGRTAVVTDVAEPGSRWSRWEHPVVPLGVPGVPRGYFVTATKS